MEEIYSKLSYDITGACFEVSHILGIGFLEKVYQEALSIELGNKGLKYEREKHLDVYYKGQLLDTDYIADFVVDDKVIVELKAVSALTDVHKAQLINYLRITGMKFGMLVNFGTKRIEIERIPNTYNQ